MNINFAVLIKICFKYDGEKLLCTLFMQITSCFNLEVSQPSSSTAHFNVPSNQKK